jgi:hypothetical protein
MDAVEVNETALFVAETYCVPVNVFEPVIANSVLFLPSSKSAFAAYDDVVDVNAYEADVAVLAFIAYEDDVAAKAYEADVAVFAFDACEADVATAA